MPKCITKDETLYYYISNQGQIWTLDLFSSWWQNKFNVLQTRTKIANRFDGSMVEWLFSNSEVLGSSPSWSCSKRSTSKCCFILKFLGFHPDGMDLKYVMNNMQHINKLSGEQDYFFTFINRAETFQFFDSTRSLSFLL